MSRALSSRPRRWAQLKPALVVWTLAAGLLALLALPGLRTGDWLMRRWYRELPGATDHHVLTRLRQIAQLNDQGMQLVAQSLGSPHRNIAQNSRIVLDERIEAWRLLPVRDSSPKVARLARTLATEVHQFGPAARRVAADLATQILLWPIDRGVVDSGQLVADCETILRAAADQRPRQQATSSELAGPAADRLPRPPPIDAGVEQSAVSLPGGDLPLDIVRIPSLEPLDEPPDDPIATQPEPTPARDRPSAATTSPPTARQAALPGPRSVSISIGEEDQANQAATATWPHGYQLQRLDDIELMRLLNADEAATTLAAADELRRRGFQDIHLELAERLTDPDPQVRIALAEKLPRLRDIESRPWLIQLSRDDDVNVRRAAVGIMATGNAPEFVQRLREMQPHERDPSTRRIIELRLKAERR